MELPKNIVVPGQLADAVNPPPPVWLMATSNDPETTNLGSDPRARFRLNVAVPVGTGTVVDVVGLGTVVVVALPTVTFALVTFWSTVLVARTSKLPGWLPAVKRPVAST